MAKGRPSKSGKRRLKFAESDENPIVSKFMAQHGDYRTAFIPDPENENKRSVGQQKLVAVVRNSTLLDRWFREGGPGFDEPQKRAVEHCQWLWQILDTQAPRTTANLQSGLAANVKGGGDRAGVICTYLDALHQLKEYEEEIPKAYWIVFEGIARHDAPAGAAGIHLANNDPGRIASAKVTVGFIASKIAEWRGY